MPLVALLDINMAFLQIKDAQAISFCFLFVSKVGLTINDRLIPKYHIKILRVRCEFSFSKFSTWDEPSF